jgi:hypothetical protein
MNITINKVPVDFSLGNEKTLGEILKALRHFLFENSYLIKNIYVNNTKKDLENIFESPQIIAEIETIEIDGTSISQEVEQTLDNISRFIDEFLENLSNKDDFLTHKKERVENLSLVGEGIKAVTTMTQVPLVFLFCKGKDGEEILSELGNIINKVKEKLHDSSFIYELLTHNGKDFLTLIQTNLIPQIVSYYNFFYLHEEKQKMIKELGPFFLERVKKNLKLFVTQALDFLQEGNENLGIITIQKNVMLFELLILITKRLEEGEFFDFKAIEKVYKDLLESIKQMTVAIESKDIVTICDLLEYEFYEKMNELSTLLSDSLN